MERKPMDVPEQMAELAKGFDACRSIFIALGDENRQHIFMELLECYDGMRVGELARRINLSRPATSHHLKIMKDAQMVNLYKKGTMNFYHVDPGMHRWEQLVQMILQANKVVREMARRKQDGKACGQADD